MSFKNKREFIDETILTTPKPQASSTIERKRLSNSHKPKEKFEKLDYIPFEEYDCKSRTSSRLSTQSSLGILSLDHVDNQEFSLIPEDKDLKNSKLIMPHPSESVTERLLMQRKLAQKAIERADNLTEKKVGSIPSYLLKPSTTKRSSLNSTPGFKDDSTINVSDLEKMYGDKISFEAKEISARSSSLGNETNKSNRVIDLTTPSPNRSLCSDDDNMSEYNAKCQAIYDKLRQSDIQFNQMYKTTSIDPKEIDLPADTINISDESNWNLGTQDSLIAKLQNELFTPAELAADRLAADELSWRKEQDTIPIDKEKLDLTCFSGYIGDGNYSTSSKYDEKISIGNFFSRKSDNIDALELQQSPVKKHNPIPLINTTNSILETPRSTLPKNKTYSSSFTHMTDSESGFGLRKASAVSDLNRQSIISIRSDSEESDLSDMKKLNDTTSDNRLSVASVISTSQIAEVLANMNASDSPTKIMNYLMNPKKKDPKILKENKSLKENIKQNKTPKKDSSQFDSVLSEISNVDSKNKSNSSSTLKNIETIQIDSDSDAKENTLTTSKNHKSILKDSPNVHEVIVINDSIHEWKDAKEPNKTISSITESPSISCSELEFSEDDTETSIEIQNSMDEWIKIRKERMPHRACVMLAYETDVFLTPISNRWILYKVKLGQVKVQGDLCVYSDNAIKMKLPGKEELLKQRSEQNFTVQFVTYVCGKIELTLIIQLTDMVSKNKKEIEHTLIIESEEAEISVNKDSLNYGVLAEDTIKTLDITVSNNSKIELPITLALMQSDNIFIFEDLEGSNSMDGSPIVTRTRLILSPEGEETVSISMCAPYLKSLQCSTHVAELRGKLVIYLQTESSKVLREVELIGRVGYTKIQFRASCLPLILTPGQTKPLYMKNSSIVPLELTVNVTDKEKITDDQFTYDQSVIKISPNQSCELNVTFKPNKKFSGKIKRYIRLQHIGNGPVFLCDIEGMKESPTLLSPSPKLSKTPTGRTSTPGRNSPRECKTASPSQRSGRSSTDSGTLSYLPNGKLPIETNRTELVWGCVKPNKSQTQEFVIRNRALQRLRFQATLSNPANFKIVKEQSELLASVSVVLHGMESKTISISFSPNAVGACSSKLTFSPIEANDVTQNKPQTITLFGYGGHAIADVQGVAKDLSGRMWLSFGKMDYRCMLEQHFILQNTGSLTAFAHLSLSNKAIHTLPNSVKISPNEAIIPPNKEIEISVKFTPRQEDIKLYHSLSNTDVHEVATLQLITGPEPTRGRIRNLSMKLNQSGSTMYSQELLKKLSTPFAGEQMPSDLNICKEKFASSSLKELLKGLTTKEVTLTVERDPEHSMALDAAVDDTCMFQSLCNDTTHLTIDNTLDSTNARRSSGGFCTIEPLKLVLTPPIKVMDTVLLSSRHSRPMTFEITEASSELQVEPTDGMVLPGQKTVITICCGKQYSKQLQFFKVMVYVENEVMEIEVKVIQVQRR